MPHRSQTHSQSGEATAARANAAAIPKLTITAPVLCGLLVIISFFGIGLSAAALAPIDRGVGLSGALVVESKVKSVQHERGGTIAAVHAAEGQRVSAGDLLVTFDTRALDEQIEALRLQEVAANRQLDLARQEAATMEDLLTRQLAARSKVLALQRQVAQIEKEVAALKARITVAIQQRDNAKVMASEDGRVLNVAVHGAGAVAQPGATLMQLVPGADRLVVEGRLSPNQVEDVSEGMAARVWLSALSWREQRPLPATLAWVSADSIVEPRTGQRHYLARIEFTQPRTEIEQKTRLMPGMRTDILLLTGQRTLLDTLLDPILRNVKRAFRETT